MAENPYFVSLRVSLAANASATLQHSIPRNEELIVEELYAQSTGAFTITSIRDSSGRLYGNLSTQNPLPSQIIASDRFRAFATKPRLSGAITLYIDVSDVSASANTITLVLASTRISQ